MTYLTIHPTKSPATCAHCPLFEDYHDGREQGYCQGRQQITHRQQQPLSTCNQILEDYTVWIDLDTEEIEADDDGNPVPVDTKVVEVVLPKMTQEAVEKTLAQCPNLQGYRLVNFRGHIKDYEEF